MIGDGGTVRVAETMLDLIDHQGIMCAKIGHLSKTMTDSDFYAFAALAMSKAEQDAITFVTEAATTSAGVSIVEIDGERWVQVTNGDRIRFNDAVAAQLADEPGAFFRDAGWFFGESDAWVEA